MKKTNRLFCGTILTKVKLTLISAFVFLCIGAAVFSGFTDVRTLAQNNQTDNFAAIMKKMRAAKPAVMKRHQNLLDTRYDLSNRTAKDAKMARGKAVQEGVRVKLPKGVSWEQLGAMTPEEIRAKGVFRKDLCRCRIRIIRKAECFSRSFTSTKSKNRNSAI